MLGAELSSLRIANIMYVRSEGLLLSLGSRVYRVKFQAQVISCQLYSSGHFSQICSARIS